MIAWLLAALWVGTAWAGPAQDAAREASNAVDRHCPDASAEDVSDAAGSLQAATAAWGEVSAAYEQTRAPFLLYWRGRLAECTNQEERALGDYQRFLLDTARDDRFDAQRVDANKRIARLERRIGRGAPAGTGGIVAGIGLAVGAGALGGLAGWQDQQAAAFEGQWHGGTLIKGEFDGVEASLRGAEDARTGLAVASGALGVGAAAALAVGAVQKANDPRRRATRTVAVVVPTAGGVALSIGGTW